MTPHQTIRGPKLRPSLENLNYKSGVQNFSTVSFSAVLLRPVNAYDILCMYKSCEWTLQKSLEYEFVIVVQLAQLRHSVVQYFCIMTYCKFDCCSRQAVMALWHFLLIKKKKKIISVFHDHLFIHSPRRHTSIMYSEPVIIAKTSPSEWCNTPLHPSASWSPCLDLFVIMTGSIYIILYLFFSSQFD